METRNQWLFELPPINQHLEADFAQGRRSRDKQAGGVEPIPRHKPRGEDDEPLLDSRIPGEKPKEKGGKVVGNRSFRTSIEARDAAKDAARQLGS
ncbi:MAG: hypothetical protein F6K28_45560, partial [Microcoleus sp. SIO2G3]|nr:hypothetical protein [Microcoleus sp. SIO2G3]